MEYGVTVVMSMLRNSTRKLVRSRGEYRFSAPDRRAKPNSPTAPSSENWLRVSAALDRPLAVPLRWVMSAVKPGSMLASENSSRPLATLRRRTDRATGGGALASAPAAGGALAADALAAGA